MRKALLFLCALFLIMLPASAVVYSIPDLQGLGPYRQPSDYSGTYNDNLICYVSVDTIYYDDYTLSSSVSKVYNLPYEASDVLADEDYIYIVFWNGVAYRIPNYDYLKDWDTIPTADAEYLGDFGATTYAGDHCFRIDVDSSGNIYISNRWDDTIYKVDGDTLTSSELLNSISIGGRGAIGLYCGSDLFVYANEDSNEKNSEVYTLESYNNYNEEFVFSGYSAEYHNPGGICELTNGNIITQSYETNNRVIAEFYPNGTLVGYLSTDAPLSSIDSAQTGDITVCGNGVIVHMDDDNNYMYTYSTVSGAGGYSAYVYSGSDDDNSSSDNPYLVDYDGDGEFTQDDAKELSLTLGPLMWIFLFMVFIVVAMNKR